MAEGSDKKRDVRRGLSRFFRSHRWRPVGRAAFVLLVIVAIVGHAVEGWDLRFDEITLGLLVFLLLALVGIDQIQELSGGGVSVKFKQLAETAEAATAGVDPELLGEDGPTDGSLEDRILKMADALRTNLSEIKRYEMAPNLQAVEGATALLTRLRLEGDLSREQAQLASQFLALAEEILRGRPIEAKSATQTIDRVEQALGTVKSRVFDRRVREKIESQDGWKVEEFKQNRSLRDFHAVHGETRLLVAARTATLRRSGLLRRTIERWGRRRPKPNEDGAMIVLPQPSQSIERGEELIAEEKLALQTDLVKFDDLERVLKQRATGARST